MGDDKAKQEQETQIEKLKVKGNAALKQGKSDEAVKLYSQALELDPNNHVLFSNRSAAFCKCNKFLEALQDAEKTIELNKDWAKGYSRKGAALSLLHRYEEAQMAFAEGLEIDPENEQLKEGIKMARSHLTGPAGSQPIGNPFAMPNLMERLEKDPSTRKLLEQPDYRAMMQELAINPTALGDKLSDPRVMQTLSALLGADLKVINSEDLERNDIEANKEKQENSMENGTSSGTESLQKDDTNSQALEEKQKGNAAYKAKDFETALLHYGKAIELDPTDITFRTNRAAVYFEQQEFDKCIKECEDAVSIGREHRADYKFIAKALGRIGNAYSKKEDFQNAITFYNKSLSEHRDPEIVKKVTQVEKLVKERERLAYIDPKKALEEKEKGNQCFQKGNYPDAIKHYNEAIKRNPDDPKIFSNRAACYTKLAELSLALKDAETCISLDPKFIKGYLRKGNILLGMKETSKAQDAFQKALDLDQNCQEAMEGFKKCVMQENDPEAVKRRAMSDPEVQQILADPAMQMILSQMQKDPKALHEHLKNPEIASKIQKLLEVGIVSIR